MATHSSILAWEIPWTEEPGELQSMGHKELDTMEQLSTCMWDFSSLTRDQTHTPRIRRQSFNCWTTREVPRNSFELDDLSLPVLVFLSCHFYQAVFITFALYCLYI